MLKTLDSKACSGRKEWKGGQKQSWQWKKTYEQSNDMLAVAGAEPRFSSSTSVSWLNVGRDCENSSFFQAPKGSFRFIFIVLVLGFVLDFLAMSAQKLPPCDREWVASSRLFSAFFPDFSLRFVLWQALDESTDVNSYCCRRSRWRSCVDHCKFHIGPSPLWCFLSFSLFCPLFVL